MSEYPKYRAITGEIQVTKQKLTVQLVQERLLKEDEVVKATAAKMKYRNKGTKECRALVQLPVQRRRSQRVKQKNSARN